MKLRPSRWFKWQSGQAMAEYWVTIPGSIMIMLAAAALVQFITGGLLRTWEGLTPNGGLDCEVQPEEEDEGPEYAQLGCHSVQLVARYYDSETDRTTVAYEVTSGCDPAISHWTLGLPDGLRDKVLSTSEAYEWGVDPNTGVSGIKFDTGYDVGGGGGGGGGGKGKGKAMGGVMLASFNRGSASPLSAPVTMDSRTVLITLSGYYDWTLTEVAIKAGTEVYHSVITAPTTPADPEEQDQCQ
jgi:hypothetical protein